jgi:hypothetical protein
MNVRILIVATVAATISFNVSPAEARRHHHHHHYRHHHYAKHPHIRNDVASHCTPNNDGKLVCAGNDAGVVTTVRRGARYTSSVAHEVADRVQRIVAHPAGCPRTLFCGCGVSVRVWGHPVRKYYLAANYRAFPSAQPGSGMVAWRWGHAVYIESYIGGPKRLALVYDPNSGHHQTRVHVRSLNGFHVVNPKA